MKDPILKLSGITKRFGRVTANGDISFGLGAGEIVALLGENGAGKTTLMSILFGQYLADEGKIEVFGNPLPPGSPRAALACGIGMVHQHFTLADNMSVLDNIILGTESLLSPGSRRATAREKLTGLMDRFGLTVDPEAQVRDLSVGERQRVEILKVLYRDARILILDEPTAVLTPQEADALFETLGQLTDQGLSVIFITHKMREVMAASDRCIVLRHGRVVFEAKTADTSPDELARAMVGAEIPRPERQLLTPGETVLSLEDISFCDRDAALRRVNLNLRSREILGIAGVSGNGQGLLADLLSGLVSDFSGRFVLKGKPVTQNSPQALIRAGVGRVPDDRTGTGVIPDMSLMENLASEDYPAHSRWGLLNFKAMAARAKGLISEFDVRCPSIHLPTRQLSGGNMQKLILARELSGKPGIILANQPTWGLDVGATAFVHTRLLEAAAQGAGVVVISEDLDELFALADRIQVIHHGRLSAPMDARTVDRAHLGLIMSGQAGFDTVCHMETGENSAPHGKEGA